MRTRQGLITVNESISTLRANWPGSEWPAAGQRLGHLMAVLSHCRWVYFYALSPLSLLQFNEHNLVVSQSSLGYWADWAPLLTWEERGEPDLIFFESPTQRELG